ncbi:hypothetical protein D047_2180A, partial [Vibrio parahaemolyticus VPTS-2010_2]
MAAIATSSITNT